MQQDASQSTLRDKLVAVVDEQGVWQEDVLETLEPATWAEWFRARLDGRDPFFPYDREEYPAGAVDLFRQLFRENTELDTEAAAEGLALYLDSLQPTAEIGIKLRQAMDLVKRVRARNTQARDEVRRILQPWIQGRELLDGRDALDDPEEPANLHRMALFALAAVQEKGDASDRETWEQWLGDERFAGVAFSGLALSLEELPERMVTQLLDLEEQSRDPFLLRYPLEALFIGTHDRRAVVNYLWDEVQRRAHPQQDWERIRTLLDRVADVSSFMLMQRRRAIDSGLAGPERGKGHPPSSWVVDFSCIPRADGVYAYAGE